MTSLNVMYDTLRFWIERGDIKDPFKVLPYLTDVVEHNSEKRGYYCSGRLGDFVVNCNQIGVSLCGSLAKYFLPSNVYTLTRRTTQEAIEKMSDEFHFDMLSAYLKRIDISTIIPTKLTPSAYYSRLGDKPRFERLQTHADTLYYSQRQRQLAFYDKTKEANAKGAEIPPSLEGCNLMRYEIRLLSSPNRLLKTPSPINGADLVNANFYYNLVQVWKREFDTIKKNSIDTIMSDNIKTPKDAKEAIFASLLQQQGQSYIDGVISDLKAQGTFSDPKSYSRLKADLNKMLQATAGAENELIKELETAISNVARYAR